MGEPRSQVDLEGWSSSSSSSSSSTGRLGEKLRAWRPESGHGAAPGRSLFTNGQEVRKLEDRKNLLLFGSLSQSCAVQNITNLYLSQNVRYLCYPFEPKPSAFQEHVLHDLPKRRLLSSGNRSMQKVANL